MRWCFVFCVVALVVSLSANDEQSPVENLSLSSAADEQQAEERSDFELSDDGDVYDLDMVETATDIPETIERSDDYLDEEDVEELPEPEALTDDEEEPALLDSIVAEQLIQELDDIGNKLQDDEETVGSSRQITSADVKKLEKLLESAGLTPHSPLMQTLMNQRKNAVPASALGPDMDGISGLRSLIGGGTPVGGGAAPSSILAPRAMTKKNVEDIKRELKLMLFGSDGQKQRRRQGSAAGRRPSGARPQQRNKSRQPAQTRQQVVSSAGQKQRPIARPVSPNEPLQPPKTPIPVFLRPPRPIRPAAGPPASSRQRPIASTRPASRPVNEIARQPISEFRQPPSDFRLPEAPFRQQVAATSFVAPPRTNNNVNQLPASVRSPPVPSQQQLPPRPSAVPRPTEEEFRLVLLSNNNRPSTKQLPPPPKGFQLPPPPGPVARPSTPALTNIQRPPPVASAPSRPILGAGAGIFSTSHFDTAPAPSAREPQQPTRNKIVQPDCELFAEGVCLSVRNYPTDIISSYLNKHRPELENMLAEVRSQSADDLVDGISAVEERKYSYNHYYGTRRQGEDAHAHRDFAEDGGFLCPSEVKYARPQLAQTSRGVWKYIINMNEHTQTIRMERCLKPGNSCSYVSPHYKSHCIQVYNYHRLLSFEEGKGMHVDIYKIPVGCSCHVQGYAYLYPPLDGKSAGHIIPPAFSTENAGNTLNRKTSTTPREPVRTAPPPEFKSGREDTAAPAAGGFLPPDGMNDFASFMDQQFGGHFGPFSRKGGSPSRRQDGDYIEEDPMEKSASEDYVQDYKERRKSTPTNYDYHPIIDYFHDKP